MSCVWWKTVSALRLVLGISIALFPFLVYALADAVSPLLLVTGLACLFGLRVVLMSNLPWPRTMLIAALLCVFILLAHNDEELRLLKLYPVLINYAAAVGGIYTLIRPPSAIARLMVRLGTPVEGPRIPYLRRLTLVWVIFFVINGSVALYLALAASTAAWAVYNGALSYLIIALLIGIELPIRRAYQRRHGEA